MKKSAYAFGLLLAASWVDGAATEPSGTSILSAPLVILDDGFAANAKSRVTLGMWRGAVLHEMGEPSLQFTRDIWVYSDFRSTNLPRAAHGDALVVVFADNRVSLLRLTDNKSVQAMLAGQKIRSATQEAQE